MLRSSLSRALLTVMVLVFGLQVPGAFASGGSSSTTSSSSSTARQSKGDPVDKLYKEGKRLVDAKQYRSALKKFEKALDKDSKNPDVLNMIAYSHRKLGDLDKAFDYYDKALAARSRFPEAREYLGEAHIQAALAEIKTLKTYGSKGDHARKDLIEPLKEAAAKY